jgi:hypothetical protein
VGRLRVVNQIARVSFVVLLAAFVTAQTPDERAAIAKKFAASAQANAAALKAYSWQMRIAVTLKGDPKPPKLYQMRFDMDGKIEKTELTAEQSAPRERGLKGRIIEKKEKEAKEWAGKLGDLVKQYLTPSPDVLKKFFGTATPVATPGGLIQIYGVNVIVPGDKMVYELDPNTQKLTRFMFNTVLDGDPVDGQVEFASLSAGPNYAARTTVNVPAKQVSALIENFNYQQQ